MVLILFILFKSHKEQNKKSNAVMMQKKWFTWTTGRLVNYANFDKYPALKRTYNFSSNVHKSL